MKIEFARPKNAGDVAKLVTGTSDRMVVCTAFGTNEAFPLVFDPDELDAYLVNIGSVLAYGEYTSVLSTPLLPGFQEYLELIGFRLNMIEVERSDDAYRHGDPAWYLLNGAARPRGSISRDPFFLSAFSTETFARLGRLPMTVDACRTGNSKHAFRSAADDYGFSVLPGHTAYTVGHFKRAINDLGCPLWAKVDGGSGGDFNKRIDHLEDTEEVLRILVGRILKGWSTLPAVSLSESMVEAAERWSWYLREREFLLDGQDMDNVELPYPIVLEVDVDRVGELISTFTAQMIVSDEAAYEVGRVETIMSPDESEFWGVRYPSVREIDELFDDVAAVASWTRDIGGRSWIGPEFFVVRDEGSIRSYAVDPNIRMPISIEGTIVHNALFDGEGAFIESNMTLPKSINDFSELRDILGEGVLYPEGNVVPMAFRTRPGDPSPILKMWFWGESLGFCEKDIARLADRGVKRGS